MVNIFFLTKKKKKNYVLIRTRSLMTFAYFFGNSLTMFLYLKIKICQQLFVHPIAHVATGL